MLKVTNINESFFIKELIKIFIKTRKKKKYRKQLTKL